MNLCKKKNIISVVIDREIKKTNEKKMSFFSRIRKTVAPNSKTKVNNSSVSNNGGCDGKRSLHRSAAHREKVDDDDQMHNYRKSTKSFNGKSLKPINSYHSDGNFDEDEHRWRSSKPNHKSNDTKKFVTHTATAPTGKVTKSSLHTPTLSRSDTFTLDEENKVQNGTYLRGGKEENTEYGDGDGRNGDNRCYHSSNTNNNNHYNNNDLKIDTNLTRNRGKIFGWCAKTI